MGYKSSLAKSRPKQDAFVLLLLGIPSVLRPQLLAKEKSRGEPRLQKIFFLFSDSYKSIFSRQGQVRFLGFFLSEIGSIIYAECEILYQKRPKRNV